MMRDTIHSRNRSRSVRRRSAASLAAGAALAFTTGFAARANADFSAVDTFEDSTLGSIAGQTADNGNVWQGGGDKLNVTELGNGNRVLSVDLARPNNQDNEGQYALINFKKPLGLGETGTFFFRINVQNPPEGNKVAVTNYDQDHGGHSYKYASSVYVGDADYGIGTRGDGDDPYDPLYDSGKWYSIWINDKAATTSGGTDGYYNIYYQADGASGRTRLQGYPGDGFPYREGATIDLAKIWSFQGTSGKVYTDDIYFDGSGYNASDPTVAVPEPASLALLGIGGGLMMLRRRRGGLDA